MQHAGETEVVISSKVKQGRCVARYYVKGRHQKLYALFHIPCNGPNAGTRYEVCMRYGYAGDPRPVHVSTRWVA